MQYKLISGEIKPINKSQTSSKNKEKRRIDPLQKWRIILKLYEGNSGATGS